MISPGGRGAKFMFKNDLRTSVCAVCVSCHLDGLARGHGHGRVRILGGCLLSLSGRGDILPTCYYHGKLIKQDKQDKKKLKNSSR